MVGWGVGLESLDEVEAEVDLSVDVEKMDGWKNQ